MKKKQEMHLNSKYVQLLLIGLLAFASVSRAQSFQIRVTLDGLKDTNIYLANYYGNKILRVDSARLDKSGGALFQNKEKRTCGLYVIYLNKDNYFDFLLGSDQQFSIHTSFTPQAKRIFKGAVETEVFQ